jgi:hypothetical protein
MLEEYKVLATGNKVASHELTIDSAATIHIEVSVEHVKEWVTPRAACKNRTMCENRTVHSSKFDTEFCDFMSFSLASSEFRAISTYEKALKLNREYNVSPSDVAKVLPISRQAIYRANVSASKNRDLAVVGRPCKLNAEEMNMYIRIVNDSLDENKEITYEEAQRLVIFYFLNFAHKCLKNCSILQISGTKAMD